LPDYLTYALKKAFKRLVFETWSHANFNSSAVAEYRQNDHRMLRLPTDVYRRFASRSNIVTTCCSGQAPAFRHLEAGLLNDNGTAVAPVKSK
jgi:hypothetical protein